MQILLQVLIKAVVEGRDLSSAIDAPRWRSEDAKLLIESSHPAALPLSGLGHDVISISDGDSRFGGVVCAGIEVDVPFAVSDWRRECWSGVV